MKKSLSFLFVFLFLFIIGEFVLRLTFGFTDAVLVLEDEQIEYLAKPSQERYRFGNQIIYNEFSMRSNSPKKGAFKILGLGDSVLNGGNLIDQKELATTLLAEDLSIKRNKDIQVLNVSYKSWGPDNALAYLKKFGNFDADLIFLVVSSHDAHDVMDFKKIVGKDVNYPSEQYSLAYFELVDRYLIPRLQRLNEEPNVDRIKGEKKKINPGLAGLVRYAQENNIPFFLYLHPELKELEKGRYNKNGQLIINYAAENHIVVQQGIFRARKEFYQDNIHLNRKGQYYMYQEISAVVDKMISELGEKELARFSG